MKFLIWLIVSCLAISAGLASSAMGAEDASQTASKATFLVIYRPGPAWLPNKPPSEQPLLEHGRYMLSLFAKGSMKAAGPFLDDTGGGAVILEVADESEAKALIAQDPAVTKGIMVPELRAWKQQPWDEFLKRQREREAASKPPGAE